MPAVIGQSRALQAICAAMQAGRMHHAWVFSGPSGVGKFTAALELARILLDPEIDPRAARPRGTGLASNPRSESSRLISAGTHPDLHIIRKELAAYSANPELRTKKLFNIPLDLLRERMLGGWIKGREFDAPVYLRPMRGHGKVFIIDEAELLDHDAQNALLKTLEEPPTATYIILVTDEPDLLRPTIRSRCQHVRFTALDENAMSEWLAQSAITLDDRRRAWILRFAEGSPGRVVIAAEHDLFAWHETLAPMLAELEGGSFPPALGDTLGALVDQFAEAWVKKHRNASKDAANKDGARLMFTYLASHLRSGMMRAIEQGEEVEPWLEAIDCLREAERHLDSNVNLKLLLANLVAQWSAVSAASMVTAPAGA